MANKKDCGFRTSIGGQALIEGILMRGPKKQAIVCRTAEGLVEKVDELKLLKDKYPIFGWPSRIIIFTTPSERFLSTRFCVSGFISPTISVGRKMKRNSASAIPSTTAVPMMIFEAFSAEKCFSIHWSSLSGS